MTCNNAYWTSAMRPLRVGLLLDGTQLQRWQAWCVETLLARGDISVELAVCKRSTATGPTGLRKQLQRLRRLPRRLTDIPWLLVDRADRRFAERDRSGAGAIVEKVPLASLPVEVPVLEVEPDVSASGLFHRLSADDLATIEGYELDVMLRFGFNILQGGILESARHGIWSFHHADNRVNRGGPPGFWEVAQGAPVTGVIVQRLGTQLDNGEVLARAWYSTNPISWNRNFHRVLAQSRTLLTDAVSHLARHGEPPTPSAEPVNLYCHALYRKPDASNALATAARCYGRRLRNKLRKKTARAQWHIRWGTGAAHGLSVHRLNKLTPPADRFWADPFPYTLDDRTWLFVEELLYEADRGRIVALEVEGDKVVSHHVVLDLDHHLSYPFLFEHGDSLYMIPESSDNGTIELWRCTHFPGRWEKVRDIMRDVCAVDSTLLAHEGRHYLFTNIARDAAADNNTELHIFVSDHPVDGAWQPHPQNPVLVDSRCARMAGGFLTGTDGSLIRCAQYSGMGYGEAIALRAIDTLTPERYAEHEAGQITPTWEAGLLGSHHLATDDQAVVLDACAHVPRWRSPHSGHSLTVPEAACEGNSQVARPAV